MKTSDGRTVLVLFDGEVWTYFVQRAPGYPEFDKVWADDNSHPTQFYSRRVAELAAQDGNIPLAWYNQA